MQLSTQLLVNKCVPCQTEVKKKKCGLTCRSFSFDVCKANKIHKKKKQKQILKPKKKINILKEFKYSVSFDL